MRRLAIGIAACATLGAYSCCVALGAGRTVVVTQYRCYLIGQVVRVAGFGFTPQQLYDVAIDGVDFGQSITDTAGAFLTQLQVGGLGSGFVQHVESLNATDGLRDANTTFTLTRSTGARFLASSGNPMTLRAPFQLWGFGLDGRSRAIYLHYVRPSGRGRSTVFLGRTGGQCGYLQTRPLRVFPFTPGSGRWKLQLDSLTRYNSRPAGPVARIFVTVR